MTARAREDVEKLLNDIRVYLDWAEIPPSQIHVADGFHYRIDHFVKAFDWLHAFSVSPPMVEFKRIFAMRPLQVWENYKSIELEGLREQVMLAEAAVELKKRWKVKRPRMFGPDKPVSEEFRESPDAFEADEVIND